tara:strand:- start:819 stop:1151 length:333 start_codon:yes stop_codon:yes gene_type:complete
MLSAEFLLARGKCCNNGCVNCPYKENTMIKLKDIITESANDGWGNDPKKPNAIDKVEAKVDKWVNGLKKGWTKNTQYSTKLDRLRRDWEVVIDKHKNEWKPKYNFGDLLA